jgi:hypothetical protein
VVHSPAVGYRVNQACMRAQASSPRNSRAYKCEW